MNVSAQLKTTSPKDTGFYGSSTVNKVAQRGDMLEALYTTGRQIVKVADDDDVVEVGSQSDGMHEASNVLSLPQFNTVPKQIVIPFVPLQEWEGYVQSVGDDEFTASLLDLTNNSKAEDEEADFPIDDLTEDDKGLLKPGAVFRWLIGYRSIGGTKERISRIVFRRLPQWTKRDLQAAQDKAKYYSRAIKWE